MTRLYDLRARAFLQAIDDELAIVKAREDTLKKELEQIKQQLEAEEAAREK